MRQGSGRRGSVKINCHLGCEQREHFGLKGSEPVTDEDGEV